MGPKVASSPVKSTASDAWDFVKGEAAAAASSILTEAAKDLESYAAKKVASGAAGVKTAVAGSPTAKSFLGDLSFGGIPTVALLGGAAVLIFLLLR